MKYRNGFMLYYVSNVRAVNFTLGPRGLRIGAKIAIVLSDLYDVVGEYI